MQPPRQTPFLIAAGRTAFGVVMVTRPTLLTRSLGVDAATARRTTWLPRMLGARELGLGGGALVAARLGGPGRRIWALAQAAADLGDAAALGAAVAAGHVSRGRGSLAAATALGAAVAGGLPALRRAG